MDRRRYRSARTSYSGHYSRSEGRERALKHIEEAQQLSKELGGTDQDVKKYFFSLTESQLNEILDAYELRYGVQARQYAEETLPKWRSGRVKMSGMVASRLFKLLPPRMPLEAKYRLIENLWRHVGPSSRKRLRVGLDTDVEDVVVAIREHIENVVVNYKIPTNLEQRFEWISSGDVHVKQELLNHLRQMEKSLVEEGAREQLPVMLDHLQSDEGHHTHRMAQVLKVGNHELEVLMDKMASGVHLEEGGRLEEPRQSHRPVTSSGAGHGWIWWLVIGAVILFFLMR